VVGANFQLAPIRDGFGYSDDRLARVGPGLDPDRYQDVARGAYRSRLGIGDDTVLIGLLARLTPIKGHEVFLRAARKVGDKRPNAGFLVSGPALQLNMEDIKREAALIGLGNRVEYLRPAKDVRELIADLDIGVVSSLGSEAISRIAMEYMAMECPVVASRVGGLPELIEDGTSGLLFDPGDWNGLADSIIELIDNPDKRTRMGAAGRERIEKYFSLNDQVDKLEEFLYRLAQLGKQGSG
jgi:glycosyltransferase involved in cell wall biosynthesis